MRWYKWVCLIILITISGIPVALFKAIGYLISGLPRYAVSILLDMPLNWARVVLVVIPELISNNPIVGIPVSLIGMSGLGLMLWLLFRDVKIDKNKIKVG